MNPGLRRVERASGRPSWFFALVLVTFRAALLAQTPAPQEAPRQLTGSLTFGWLDSSSRDILEERRNNPFTSLKLDFHSYLLDPDVFTYRIEPRFSSGFQDAFTGLTEGTGVAVDTMFFRRRAFPFRFHYSRFRRAALMPGLGSSYARFVSKNDDSRIGIQWQYVAPRMPRLEFSVDKATTANTPEAVLTQGFSTQSRDVALTARDTRAGFNLTAGVTSQRLDTQYVLAFDLNPVMLENHNRIQNVSFTADRSLPGNLTFSFSANRNLNRALFDKGDFVQGLDSYSAKLEYKPDDRFQAWTQARLTQTDLQSHLSPLVGGTLVLPPSLNISNRILDSEARFQVNRYLTLFGRNEFTHVSTTGNGFAQQPGNFMNTGGGVQASRSGRLLVLSGSYYIYATTTDFLQASSAHMLGHTLDGSAAVGDPARTGRVAGGYTLNRSTEEIRSVLPYTSASDRVRLSVTRAFFRRWTLELQGALSSLRYTRQETSSNFHGKDYGASLAGPNYFVSYMRSTGSGNSFQPLLGLSSIAPIDLTHPLLLAAGSSNSTTSLNAAWNINHHFGLRGIWRGQVQTIGNLLASRFEQQEATVNYQLRKMRFEAGYLVYRYNFGTAILRKSLIFRLTREFTVF